MKYAAVIIEPRCHNALSFVLENVATCLSDDWGIIICHGTLNKEFVKKIVKRLPTSKEIILHPLSCENLTINMYNLLLTSKSFYDIIPTETFLIFQTDSMIFPRFKHLIHDFMEYDYVGAPWDYTLEKNSVGNGGFSLRKKSKMLEILNLYPYTNEMSFVYEDWYFSKYALNKPTFEKAKQFSIESVFSPKSFGCHKPWYFTDKIWCKMTKRKLFHYYPECKPLSLLQSSVPVVKKSTTTPIRNTSTTSTTTMIHKTSSRNIIFYLSFILIGIILLYFPILYTNWYLRFYCYYSLVIIYLILVIIMVSDLQLTSVLL